MTFETSRRGFLRGATAAGAALVIGLRPDGALAARLGDAATLNPFVKISPDGAVTVIIKHFEMGQGTTTGLATLVAEELDASWEQVKFEYAPADNERYANLLFGAQGTGGSTAMANSFMQYRKAGAAARTVLIQAAAEAWGSDPAAITITDGMISDGSNETGFGDMVTAAAAIPLPEDPPVKDPADFRLIGRETLQRKDTPDKINGTATFAMDIQLPDMVTAVILRAPKFGGKLTSFDATGAEDMRGFVDAKALPDGSGVAVYASSTWAAFQARDAISAEWDFSEAETRSTPEINEALLGLVRADPEYVARAEADTAAQEAIAAADQVIEAEFLLPALAHAPMEPLTCTIEPTETGVRVHDGCQFPAIAHPTIAGVLELDPAVVEIRTLYAGGSFGRRANPAADYHMQAAMAFALTDRSAPVKLVWSREDDLKGGFYRPMAAHRARIGLASDGTIVGWDHRIATKSIFKGTTMAEWVVHDGVDHASVEGIADTVYALPNLTVGLSDFQTQVPVLWWRSVGHSHTAYVMESLIDMAAEAVGQDPVAYRLSLLEGGTPDQARLAGVIRRASEEAGWSEPLPMGWSRGVAAHKSFETFVAHVVEVSTDADGAVRIERVVSAVDCGVPVNPDVIRAQIEGGTGFGIGAVMRNQITFSDGEVDQWNFPDYEPLRMGDIGRIDVHVIPSTEAPTGVGEPGVPSAGPALANAIAAATGLRAKTLPMAENGVTFAA
ncbi:molybdopterin cofactor-binding domain-containing protein [Amaricoccus macauensis]|uniref:xanthine dehydrogenase family protein molybdopterin-binding subunit n=1 Tax=Amaricoccus macauensis TaxID=57001 RepID=UPI003C7B579C